MDGIDEFVDVGLQPVNERKLLVRRKCLPCVLRYMQSFIDLNIKENKQTMAEDGGHCRQKLFRSLAGVTRFDDNFIQGIIPTEDKVCEGPAGASDAANAGDRSGGDVG